jgi:hypothetical protein
MALALTATNGNPPPMLLYDICGDPERPQESENQDKG